jgi:hypothetical protein
MGQKNYEAIFWFRELKNITVPKDFVGKNYRCVGCGCFLTTANRSINSMLCKNCFMVDLAEVEAEDRRHDA